MRRLPRENGPRKRLATLTIAFAPLAFAANADAWIAHPAGLVEGAVKGRACVGVGAPPSALIVDGDDPVALRLPNDMWARIVRLEQDRRGIVLEGRSVGTLARSAGGWQAALAGGNDECAFDGFRATFDDATVSDAPPADTIRATFELGDRLHAAAIERAAGNTVEARATLGNVDLAAVPALRLRAYLHRARVEIEAGDAAAAATDLANAAALREARAFDAPVQDAFERAIALRVIAARGGRDDAITGREALDRELAVMPGVPREDRIANRVYLAVAQIARRRIRDAAATLDGWMAEVGARFDPADPVRVDAVVANAIVGRSAGRFREAQEDVAALLHEVGRTSGTSNLAYAVLATRYALNAAVAQRPLEAVPAAARAVAWFAAELGRHNALTRDAREIYAYALAVAERLPEAIAVQREVVAAYDGADDATPSGRITVRHTLANFLGRDERYAQAEAVLTQLLAEASTANVTPDRVAHLELDLAHARWETRGAEAACTLVDRVRAEVDGGVVLTLDVASDYDSLVARCAARIAPREGIASLRQIVARRMELFGADSVGMADAQAALARAQMDSGDNAGARATLEALAATIERLRAIEVPDAGGVRNAFARWLRSDALSAGYRDLAYLYARDGDVTRAIAVADAARARSLNDAIGLERDMAGLPSRDQYRASALARRLREQEAEAALMEPNDPARVALDVARIDTAAELESARRGLSGVARPRSTPLDLDAARARLPLRSAFVGLQVVRGGVWGYVVRRDRPPSIVSLERVVPLLPAIGSLRVAMSAPEEARAPLWRTTDGGFVNALTPPETGARRIAVRDLSEELGKAILGPLLPYLHGITTLIVAADSPLGAVPLDALRLGGAPIATRFALRYAPSLGVWAARAAAAPHDRFRRDLIAIGAPNYATMTPTASGPLPARVWAPLPGAAAELETIAALFPGDRRAVASGDAASKAWFIALARDGGLASTRYLHVAAHGLLAADAPQWSSIVLDGGGAPGYLTAAEIATLDIRADLVVLSACDTALGKDVAGEGVFGLPYAFAVAGARATLLTLWPVADQATSEFMRLFYTRLTRGASPVSALAQTKREFIRSPKYSAPFFWAPFALFGN